MQGVLPSSSAQLMQSAHKRDEGSADACGPHECALRFPSHSSRACCACLLFSTTSLAQVAACRAAAEKLSLEVGRSLLVDASDFESIEAVISYVQHLPQW